MVESGTVTLLFTDLVNSTVHLQNAGDEAGQGLFRAHHKLLTDAITTSGGEELQWLGDGVLAAFSSSADAVRAAIAMQQSARRPIGGVRLEIRIGIHAGEVLRREGGYFGTPLVIARRLCDRAQAGQILCSRLVADLLAARQSFAFRDLGTMELKGIATPVSVCEVAYRPNDPSAQLSHTPFVGRENQLQRLSAKLEQASKGKGALAMLTGEPGIGKTRMLEEFSDLARQQGVRILSGACREGECQRPYGPFAEAIGQFVRESTTEELNDAIGRVGATLARIAPELRDRLPNLGEPPALDKEEERFRVLDCVAQFVANLAQRAPLMLILDDLHWADPGTAAMLSHVARSVSQKPILLVGAYRDAEIDRRHPLTPVLAGLRRLANFEAIALGGLPADAIGELLGTIGDVEAPAELIKALSTETEGNPFFIREILLHLAAEGKIFAPGNAWTTEFDLDRLGIPPGVREVVALRLSKLSEDANRLLIAGAAFNGPFAFDIAREVAGLTEDRALAALDEAIDAQLVRATSDAQSLNFAHALVRTTLYLGTSAVRRVRLHRQIAEAMERAWGERVHEHAAEVAYQFWRGAAVTDAGRGVDYAIAAADNAEAAYDYDEVAAFLRIALELLLPHDSRRPRMLARRAAALTWTMNAEEALKTAHEAGEMIAVAEGEDAAADYFESAARAMRWAGLMRASWEVAKEGLRSIGERRDIVWASLKEIDLAREEAEDPENPGIPIDSDEQRELRSALKRFPREQLATRRIAQPYDSRDEIIHDAKHQPQALLLLAGDYRSCRPIWQKEAATAEHSGRLAWAMNAWTAVARCCNAMGDFPAAQAALDRATVLTARAGRPSLQVINLVSVKQDFFIATDESWEEIMAFADASGILKDPPPESRWAFGAICAAAAQSLARLGQTEKALPWLARVCSALPAGAPWAFSYSLMACDAASVLWTLGRTDHLEVVEHALRHKVVVPDFRFPMRDSRLSMARLCALSGRYDEAKDWFAKARAVLDEQGALPLRAIADFDEAQMHLHRAGPGDLANAAALADMATDQFRKLGMSGWLRRARDSFAA